MSGAAAPPPALAAPRAPSELFGAFTRLALQGFGGVLPVAQRELVERLRWLSPDEFLRLLSLAQVLPGPNIVNLALMIGDRHFGTRGALASVAGVLAAPLAVVLALAVLAARWQDVPAVAGALRGMGVVAAGLVASTGLKLSRALARNPLGRLTCGAGVVLTALAIGYGRLPLVAVVAGLGGVLTAMAWRVLGRGSGGGGPGLPGPGSAPPAGTTPPPAPAP